MFISLAHIWFVYLSINELGHVNNIYLVVYPQLFILCIYD